MKPASRVSGARKAGSQFKRASGEGKNRLVMKRDEARQ